MYNHTLRQHNEYLAKEQAIPQNGVVDGNGDILSLNGTLGAIEIVVIAELETHLGANKTISLYLEESSTKQGEYTKSPISASYTTVSGQKWNKGDIILRLPVSTHTKSFVKAKIGTDDASASGQISVIPSYLPR
ncbi:MAG: hypothetical protein ACRCV3_03655 [Desulfovibrionaceae bacterium]